MADPHKDLAPIIEPPAPPVAPMGGGHVLPLAAGGLALLLVLFVLWVWRRRAPLRALYQLKNNADPVEAAHRLSALLRRHAVQPDTGWRQELERLRFGPPAPDAAGTLLRLCHEAELLLRRK